MLDARCQIPDDGELGGRKFSGNVHGLDIQKGVIGQLYIWE